MSKFFKKIRRQLKQWKFDWQFRDMNEKVLELYTLKMWLAINAILKKLNMSETAYRSFVGADCSMPRDYFFYGELDQVFKMTYSVKNLRGFMGKHPSKWKKHNDDLGRHLFRMAIETIMDQLHALQRKLAEVLIVLLNFKQTNKEDAYRAYMAVQILNDLFRVKKDWKEFYGLEDAKIDTDIAKYQKRVTDCLQRLGVSTIWFLEKAKFDEGKNMPGASMRNMFKEAIKVANSEEKLALGASYDEAFAERSAAIHNSVGSRQVGMNENRIIAEMVRCCILGFHVIRNVHELSGIPFSKEMQEFQSHYSKTNAVELFQDARAKDLHVSDIVLVYGEVGEVTERIETQYGYTSFKVKCLTAPTSAGTPEQVFLSIFVEKLCAKSEVRQYTMDIITSLDGKGDPVKQKAIDFLKANIASIPDEDLYVVMKDSFVTWRKAGLPVRVRKKK